MAEAIVQKPEVIYDEESDILRLQLQDKPSVQSVEVAEGVVLDYDSDGKVVAIEIDGVGKVLSEFRVRTKAISAASIGLEVTDDHL